MEVPPVENCQPATNSSEDAAPQDQNNDAPELSDANGARESEHKLSAEEVKSVLEIIASTGKFWHDWDELKSMLAFQLKQNTQRPQRMKINKIHLWERVLQSWQKDWTKILLDARTIYPNLSKLALALEKNLLVTSTLTKSTDPYPSSTVQVSRAAEEQLEDVQPQLESQPEAHSNSVENGREPMAAERDEVMSELDARVDDRVTMDMDSFEEIISPSDSNSEPTENS
ncbi:hypothetical protein Cgig2_013299 [Carnegiea gigantea]|uniref:Uncharacterized protein n=1 Tax=Carnegiea gigantea TaxID=171969 RepID=A0A9Q1JLN0_9CARY|nr:hypothetical protein Cgig2_013299 [Carnegiea gigantea]